MLRHTGQSQSNSRKRKRDDREDKQEHKPDSTRTIATRLTRLHTDPHLARLQYNPIAPEDTLVARVKKLTPVLRQYSTSADAPSFFSNVFSLRFWRTPDYSQETLIDRINTCQQHRKKYRAATDGYCHGISLLYLTMCALGLGSLFFNLMHRIDDSHDRQLITISRLCTLFLDLIERGQNPETCLSTAVTQDDVDWITGIPRLINPLFIKIRRIEQLIKVLEPLIIPGNLLSISGWSYTVNANKKIRPDGHTICVVIGETITLFDPSDKTGDVLICPDLLTLAKAIDQYTITRFNGGPYCKTHHYEIHALRRLPDEKPDTEMRIDSTPKIVY